MIANTPNPPYYAVIFTSIRTDGDNGYSEMATQMEKLANSQPGFLGMETARRNAGITVSYWKDLDSIKNWRNHAEHVLARKRGRKDWYKSFKVRISKVVSDYAFEKK